MTPAKHDHSQVSRSTDPAHVSAAPPEPEKGAPQSEIEADIERTRRELGETVGSLAEKLDVKAQAREQINEAKHRMAEQANEARHHARTYIDQAKMLATDEHGKPSRNAWIGAGALAVSVALVVIFSRSRT